MRFSAEGLRAIAEFCLWLADQDDTPSEAAEPEAEAEAEGDDVEPPPPEAEVDSVPEPEEIPPPVRVWRAPDLPAEPEPEPPGNPGVPEFRPEIVNRKRKIRADERRDLPVAFATLPPGRLMTAKEISKKTGLDGQAVWAYIARIRVRAAQKDALGTNQYSTDAILSLTRQKLARAQ
jgi:hypothetical protein